MGSAWKFLNPIAGTKAVFEGFTGETAATAQEAANQAAAENAQKQMDFQERMSNTAYQRQMADMGKAGLNPILAMNAGGSSAPSGAAAPVQAVTARGEAMGKIPGEVLSLMSGAKGLSVMSKGMQQADAQIDQAKAGAAASLANAQDSQASAASTLANIPKVQAQAAIAQTMAERDASQAHLEKAQADYGKGFVKVDAWTQRIREMLGGIGDVLGLGRMKESLKTNLQREHEFLTRQGSRGASVRK